MIQNDFSGFTERYMRGIDYWCYFKICLIFLAGFIIGGIIL